MTAHAETRDHALSFAEAVSDYCYGQVQAAEAAGDEGGRDKWDEATSAADDLLNALRACAEVVER